MQAAINNYDMGVSPAHIYDINQLDGTASWFEVFLWGERGLLGLSSRFGLIFSLIMKVSSKILAVKRSPLSTCRKIHPAK
jgi:hypothetical protein